MLDREWLGQWVQSSHLSAEALDAHRASYRACSVPVVQVPEFLNADLAQKLATFLASEAEYKEIYGLRDPDEQVPREKWQAADDDNRMYKFLRFQQAHPDVRSLRPFAYKRFRDAISDARFRTFFEQLTDLSLGELQSFGGKAYRAGDYLRPHDDTGRDRRLAFIIYLNPNWASTYGGALQILGNDGQEMAFEPVHNSLVAFDVRGHHHHCVGKIEEAAGDERRQTLGGWFKAPGT